MRSSSNSFAKASSAMIHKMVSDLPFSPIGNYCRFIVCRNLEDPCDVFVRGIIGWSVARYSNEKMNAPLDNAKIVPAPLSLMIIFAWNFPRVTDKKIVSKVENLSRRKMRIFV